MMQRPTQPGIDPASMRAAGLTRATIRLKRAAQLRFHTTIRLQTIMRLLGQDGLLALNAMLAILNIALTPIQGISLPLGFMQIMIVIALLRGKQTFWLPRRGRLYPLKARRLHRLLDRWTPALYRLEKISRPRLPRLMRWRGVRLTALWLMLILAILVALPIPLLNTSTSFAALLLCIALINHDGLMWLAGVGATVAHGLIVVFWQEFSPHLIYIIHSIL